MSLFVAALGWAMAVTLSAQSEVSLRLTPELTVTGSPGEYQVQWAQVLNGATNWVALTNVMVSNAPVVFIDATPADQTRRFYRVVCLTDFNPDPTNLVWIPGGQFTMGSPLSEPGRYDWEGPQTSVTLTRGYWMSKFLVTQGTYQAMMGFNPSYFTGDTRLPMEQVSWFDATNYCGRLTARERSAGRLPAGYVYRLPTEAEWEYACRAGTTTRFYWGDDSNYSRIGDYAWYDGNSGNKTHPVGLKKPNSRGLYDLSGNVREWCMSWYGRYPGGSVTNPPGPNTGAYRVLRGGGWGYYGGDCRSAVRGSESPGYRNSIIGFRPVLAPDQP